MFSKLPDYTHMKAFGCLTMAYNPDRHNKDKFSTKVVPCIFLGYPTTQRGYKLKKFLTKQQFVSRDVKFFPMQPNQPKPFMNPLPFDISTLHLNITPQIEHVPARILSDDVFSNNTHITTHETSDNPSIISQPRLTLRKSTRQTHPPTWLNDFVTSSHTNQVEVTSPVVTTDVRASFANMVTRLVESEEPTSYYEAASQPGWVDAMTKELQALQENNET